MDDFLSDSDRIAVFEEAWHGTSIPCPKDHTLLRIRIQPSNAGYLIFVTCPRCNGNATLTRRDDPNGDSYSSWSDDEKAMMVEQAFHQEPIDCPACFTPIRPTEDRTEQGTHLHLRCLRCGNHHEHHPGN